MSLTPKPARPFLRIVAAIASGIAATAPISPALAGMSGTSYGGTMASHGVQTPGCKNGSTLSIYKPVTITKNVSIYKPVTIDKNINIVTNIDNSKNITINKNIDINKSIVINKGSADADAEASAFAEAMASASANANANVTVNVGASAGANSAAASNTYVGSYSFTTVNNRGSSLGAVHVSARCVPQEASVVKAIHAVCVSADGHEFPASHMVAETWIDASYEGEIMRCIPGSHLKVTIGDVLQSDQGMAGTYENGQILQCADHEALRHFKGGMLKCAPAVAVPDCTERTNLRKYGTSDLFFTFRTTVCVSSARTASAETLEVTGMSLDGGVGDSDAY
jgi:hypothetical protein